MIGYIHYEAPVEEQNFSTLIEFINAMEVREDDEEFKNPVDLMFDALEAEKPNHFAVRVLPYLILRSCARLHPTMSWNWIRWETEKRLCF